MNRTGELIINTYDAWTTWGVFMTDTALSTLIEPVPLKDPVSNTSSSENGTLVLQDETPLVAERDMTLPIAIYAATRDELYQQLTAFKTELKKRRIEISTKYETGVVYRCDYQSCTAFKSYHKGLAKFSLKVKEPNPANRTTTDTDATLYEHSDL